MMSLPFTPGRTIALAVTGTSASVAVNADAPVLRLLNMGPDLVFVRIGTGPQTATLTDFPILPGSETLLTKGVGADMLAAVADMEVVEPDPPPEDPPPPEDEEPVEYARRPSAAPRANGGLLLYITTGHGT